MKTLKFSTTETNIWYSADLHIGHSNICSSTSTWPDKSACRIFSSVEKMNSTIIDNINSRVKEDDVLFILGDILFGNKIYLPTVRNRILCKNVYLIYGNHDHFIERDDKYKRLFTGTYDKLQLLIDNKTTIILDHFSHRVWEGSHKGFIHLYGHSHGSIEDYGRSMDVGVDAIFKKTGEYKPISFQEVMNIMKNIDNIN